MPPADIAGLQAAFDNLSTQVAANTDVEASAIAMLNQLGALLLANATDAAAVTAIATGLTDKAGALNASATSLAAAITANTPAA